MVVGMNTVCCHIRALGGERGLVGKDEGGLIAIEELYKEVEGLPGGDGKEVGCEWDSKDY